MVSDKLKEFFKQREYLRTFFHNASVVKEDADNYSDQLAENATVKEMEKELTEKFRDNNFNELSQQEKNDIQNLIDKSFLKVSYERPTFWSRLMRSKSNPKVELRGHMSTILDAFGRTGDDYVRQAIWRLKKQQEDFRRTILKRTHDAKYAQQMSKKEDLKNKPETMETSDGKTYINPQKICLVRVMNDLPKKNNNGEYVLDTAATLSNLKLMRNSVHFAINHHVGSHIYGSWSYKPYVILCPLKDAMERNNRKPLGFSLVDTYFETGLNESFILPKGAHMVRPSSASFKEGEFYKIGPTMTIYKTTGFTETEKKTLLNCDGKSFEKLSERDKLRELEGYIGHFFDSSEFDMFKYQSWEDMFDAVQDKELAALAKYRAVGATLSKYGYQQMVPDYKRKDCDSGIWADVARTGAQIGSPHPRNTDWGYACETFGQWGLGDNTFYGNKEDVSCPILAMEGLMNNKPEQIPNWKEKSRVWEMDGIHFDMATFYRQKGEFFAGFKETCDDYLKNNEVTSNQKEIIDAFIKRYEKIFNSLQKEFFEKYPDQESFKEGVFNFLSKKEHTATVSKTQKTLAIKAPLLKGAPSQNR